MRKVFVVFAALCLSVLYFSCSGGLNNSIKFRNLAQAPILVNFRGEAISVASGKTAEVKNVPNGTYSYNTTYSIPPDASTSSAEGAASGDVIITAGTKILVLYSSTYSDGNYILSATISSSDDITEDETTP